MAIIIGTNIGSLQVQRNLSQSQAALGNSLNRLSSGKRINSAQDDAAGLAISQRLAAQISGLNQARRNANDGVALSQTAEGALGSSGDILQRMRQLAVQAANGTNSPTDRSSLQNEIVQLRNELDRISTTTKYNNVALLDGTFQNQTFQIGANADENLTVSIQQVRTTTLGNNTVASNQTTGAISAATTAASSLPSQNNFGAQTLTVSGSLGSQSTSALSAGTTAYAIAAAVNSITSSTGVTASASTTATLSSLSASGTVTFNLTGQNSSAQAISATIASTSDLTALASAINNYSSSTGITATSSGGTLSLVSSAGYDVGIDTFAVNTAGNQTISFAGRDGAAVTLTESGNNSSRAGGRVNFDSSGGFSAATSSGTTFLSASSVASTLSALSGIDLSSQTGANAAIRVLDAALDTVSSVRSALGTYQSRFQSAASSAQTTELNLQSAQSAIVDADFAQETSNLTKAQVLQQAGVSVLKTANQSSQLALTLLQ